LGIFMMYRSFRTTEERPRPPEDETTFEEQPFLHRGAPVSQAQALVMSDLGSWQMTHSPEQMAYALGQVTAANILPSLTGIGSGTALLEYQVYLRDHLEDSLVRELALVLESCGLDSGWERVAACSYACVIGAGVAACIDTTRGQEQLYLRYANALADELGRVQRAAELPRSLLFLQTTLHEKLDALLAQVRSRTWYWLVG